MGIRDVLQLVLMCSCVVVLCAEWTSICFRNNCTCCICASVLQWCIVCILYASTIRQSPGERSSFNEEGDTFFGVGRLLKNTA